MIKSPRANIPTILVAFGATGDLMTKKIVPALFHLFRENQLPDFFRLVGFSLENFSQADFKNHIIKILSKGKKTSVDKGKIKKFPQLFSFQKGLFQNKKNYKELAKALKTIDESWGVCSNKLFYLAVPPQYYETIFKNLAASGLTIPCGPGEGWTRVIVEKPFGKDLKTAKALDELLNKLFKESQIYRIDHYLAKEMLQNILVFRFCNNLFEGTWDNKSIEKIDIRILESIGVEDRGAFYDGVGGLRDVGQNHLMQELALITMENPLDFQADSIRSKRAEILRTLESPKLEEILKFSFRAQYEGYRRIKGVGLKSDTETYFKIRAFLKSPQWQGVPITLESGKRLGKPRKEIEVTFKHAMPCLCQPGLCFPKTEEEHFKNKIIFSLEPEEKVTIQFWSKKPGLKMQIEKRSLDFLYRKNKKKVQYVEEYERLLLDCIAGDQTLFVSTEEVREMWRFADPIIKAWQNNKVPLKIYKPDTDQPVIESKFIDDESASSNISLKKGIGIVGLGKMGANMARRLLQKGWRVAGFDESSETMKKLSQEGIIIASRSLEELVNNLPNPKIIWLMVPAGKIGDEVIFGKNGLVEFLRKGDIIVDGGNSYFKDSAKRFEKLKKLGIKFVDVGVSGGPGGALGGAALMVGGEKKLFSYLEPLFRDLAKESGYQFFSGSGAGHFVKMIHNGIEYGMMQAIAEGFTLLKKSEYKLNLAKVADIYNNGSVIESRLVGWLKQAFEIRGETLEAISGKVEHTGEGAWTIKTAKEMKIKAKIIEEALKFRIQSKNNPSYTGKILSALRERFGGHKVAK